MVVIGIVAACSASPSLYFSGPQYYSGGYYPSAVVSPIKSQYHTQNELGQYAYGYNDGYSSKSETKHANGLTEGAYSYVDPNGVLQQYKYVSDENGYRVTGTNLPAAPQAETLVAAAPAPVAVADESELPQPVQDTPEVAAAKVAHQAAYDEAKKAAEASPDESSSSDAVEVPAAIVPAYPAKTTVVTPAVAYGYHQTAYGAYPSYPSYAYAAQAPVATYAYAAPAPYAAPVAYTGSYSPVHSQYHAQDEYGQYSYGYNSGSSSKSEVKTLDGITRGGYSYVDANGLLQQYQYVSDPVNGFRVTGTNLPNNSL